MKEGDLVRATWSDGLVLEGRYVGSNRGYIILIDKTGQQIVCNPVYVKFETMEARE